ncbi:efflux RND transporter periplasmic adaptor subunit [Pseudomonas citronellolis]|uniref:efflux RND transporter periplasmic adaptor subunit n=1 Tax=Pseudomonas citronellolis TaxID=53408 RepID=UPI0023E40FF6|nr:HlyD family efflux transporter periplasmic adaptor subunit [Pseudomonas citronellolis]MDF3932362.1 HlyD family efflux transporter periplasmic adaptor subunit [Pseudomonas citronellolis]
MNASLGGSERVFAQFLAVQRQARAADSLERLAFAMVNDGQALFGFRHAALVIAGKVRALTGVSVVEPNAPFVAFIERASAELQGAGLLERAAPVDAAALTEQTRRDLHEFSLPQAFWLPLKNAAGVCFGGLWLAREQPWNAAEQALLGELGDTYAHAWRALQPRLPLRLRWPKRRIALCLGGAALLLLIPLRQSALAPAEVVPRGGLVIAAPLDGVIAQVVVRPNQAVRRGDLLVRFDATSLKAQADVAERALAVAEAELKANTQRAFQDAESAARLDLLAARVEQKRAERDYARDLLQRSEVRAGQDGVAVFADAERWTGKPVRTGERLMEIADPASAELRIELPAAGVMSLEPDAQVALFLDNQPLTSVPARLQRIGYEAEPVPGGGLAYRLVAGFDEAPPRIGLRGTAKLYGDRVPLGYYLLRRPLAALRQTLGL